MHSISEAQATSHYSKASEDPLWIGEDGLYQPYHFWLSLCGIYDLYAYSLALLGDIQGQQILDCGCGVGHTSIMFAKRGAKVIGFDGSNDQLEVARTLAKANDVTGNFLCQHFENLALPDEQFDLAFGSCILHHVDIARAARELSRILVPGGKAVFIETSARNPILMMARRKLCGSFGIPKYGDDEEEHPLTQKDVDLFRSNFEGESIVHYPSFIFLRLLDLYVFRNRWSAVTLLLRAADKGLGKIPWLRQYSYYKVIELTKTGDSANAS